MRWTKTRSPAPKENVERERRGLLNDRGTPQRSVDFAYAVDTAACGSHRRARVRLLLVSEVEAGAADASHRRHGRQRERFAAGEAVVGAVAATAGAGARTAAARDACGGCGSAVA